MFKNQNAEELKEEYQRYIEKLWRIQAEDAMRRRRELNTPWEKKNAST